MKIPYAVTCPSCKKEGKGHKLHRDLSNVEEVFCEAGHKFKGPEIEEYLTSTEEVVQVASAPVDSVELVEPAVVKALAKEIDAAAKRVQAVVGPPLLKMDPPPPDLTAMSALAKQRAPELSKEDFPGRVMLGGQEAKAVVEALPRLQKPAVALPGGALEITVTIPD
jgi:hypothetical protein